MLRESVEHTCDCREETHGSPSVRSRGHYADRYGGLKAMCSNLLRTINFRKEKRLKMSESIEDLQLREAQERDRVGIRVLPEEAFFQ